MARMNEILKATNKKLENIETERTSLKKGLRILDKDSDNLSKVKEALDGLKRTRKQMKRDDYDAGKNDTAYFYCSSIEDDDIIKSNRKKLHVKCPECESNVPVLMSYEQLYDSPQGDLWGKTAFSTCICGNYNEIKKISKERRF